MTAPINSVSIRELHESTGDWVRRAARERSVVVTDRGRPVAVLRHYSAMELGGPALPNREKEIGRLPFLGDVDSATGVSAERDAR